MALARALSTVPVVLALAGCGTAPKAVVAPDAVLRLRLDEFRILPAHLEAPTGRIEIVGRDVGVLTHNVKVLSTTKFDHEGNPIILGGTTTVQPGEVARGTVTLAPGRYGLACTVGNHDNLGQYATLVVTGRS